MTLHVLASWHYMDRKLYRQMASVSKVCPVLMDSGAFSAWTQGVEIDFASYMRACAELGPHLYGYVQLDVLEQHEATLRNLDIMEKAGLSPMPVMTLDMPTRYAPELAARNPLLCVAGGVIQPARVFVPRLFAIAKAAPSAKVHALGYTRGVQVGAAPLVSVDSSTYKEGGRFGTLSAWDPEVGFVRATLRGLKEQDPRGWHPAIRRTIFESGFSARSFLSARHSGLYSPLYLLSLVAWLQYADWLAERGRRLFFAIANAHEWGPLLLAAIHRKGASVDWRSASSERPSLQQAVKHSPVDLALQAQRAAATMKEVRA